MVAPYLADQTNDLTYPVDNLAMPTLRVVDHDIADGTSPLLDTLSIPPSDEVTAEVDGATEWLGVAADEILLAALGRTIARTIGDGVVAVDVTGERRWLLHAIPLICATAQQASATEMLGNVHRMFGAVPAHAAPLRVGDLPQLHRHAARRDHPDVRDAARPGIRAGAAGVSHRRTAAPRLVVRHDRFDRYTVEELTEQFPFALFEMTSDAAAPV